jgi:signal transduction histidine kinase
MHILKTDNTYFYFLNLILNATQAMPRGGRLEIATSITKNGRTRVKVADSGTGISEEHLSKIFDPFFTTMTTRRIGLGLSLLAQSARESGGGRTSSRISSPDTSPTSPPSSSSASSSQLPSG